MVGSGRVVVWTRLVCSHLQAEGEEGTGVRGREAAEALPAELQDPEVTQSSPLGSAAGTGPGMRDTTEVTR